MKPENVFKRYDIRGKYPEEIDEEFAEFLGRSLGTFVKNNYKNKVVVGRDNKNTSKDLKKALIGGLKATGIKVYDIGEGPTDYAAWSGKNEGCVSVEVTSSHMPLNFNGFKLMYPEGNGFVNNDLYEIQDIFRSREFTSGKGSVESKRYLKKDYMDDLVEFASKFKESEDRKVVVESLGGTGIILPELLEKIGHEVIDISSDDKPYIDPPKPKPEKLEKLEKAVKTEGAYLGISNDLDADRITAYHNGRFLTGDELFCVLAQLVEGSVVASIDSSQALEDLKRVEYTRVGDPFVMDKAIELDAELAGEPNGHYSFTELVPYNSGILTALILSGLDLEEKLSEIPDYTVSRDSLKVKNKDQIIENLKEKFEREIVSELDGVKFEHKGSEVLVRPSGSSPKVRIISESKEKNDSREALSSVKSIINQF